jgi:hypothetical protein
MNGPLGSGLKVTMAGLVLLFMMTVGCIKREEFPKEPRIKFERLEQFGDSASLTISFTDGDGDIGLDDDLDKEPHFEVGGEFYYNLFVTFEDLRNGEWHRPDLGESPIHGRIPRITPTGQNKLLKGEISMALPWPVLFQSPHDTVRFHLKLVDRALNESNTVNSGTIIRE